MFGKKCVLCGGKLKGNICTECGLDNSKNDSQYQDMLNKSVCDGEPLTHIHEESKTTSSYIPEEELLKKEEQAEKQAERSVNRPRKKSYTFSPDLLGEKSQRKKESRSAFLFLGLMAAFGILLVILATVRHLTEGEAYKNVEVWDASEDGRYDNVQYALSATGESKEVLLYAGEYVVGVHVPEGAYRIRFPETEGDCTLSIDDPNNSIYIYRQLTGLENLDSEDLYEDVSNQITNVYLYRGAKMKISGEGYLILNTENAQPMEDGMENPLTEAVQITEGQTLTAGTDFPAGVYDVLRSEDGIYLDFEVPPEPGKELADYYMSAVWLNEGNKNQEICYKNLVIPSGVKVSLFGYDTEENPGQVTLCPSERIMSEDYESYYDE